MKALLLAVAALSLRAQAVVGRLHYVTGPGRAVTLQVLDGGHRAFVTLRPEQGQAGVVRAFVLSHTGPERLVAPMGRALAERAPEAWKVSAQADRHLLQGDGVVYWSYTPGLVLPVRFTAAGAAWRLLSAEVPPRMFVGGE